MILGSIIPSYASESLTTLEQTGRKIYRTGNDGRHQKISAMLGLSGGTVAATDFPCANCHGLHGEGSQEGGLEVPALTASKLFPRYDKRRLTRAITQGMNADHKLLHDAMPRYRLAPAQMKALLAYIQKLGTSSDNDPGISETSVQLTTLLPLSGPLAATGQILQQTLEACLAEKNSEGPIYGRTLNLHVVDSGSNTKTLVPTIKRLINEKQSFAFIAAYLPDLTDELVNVFKQEDLPVIAPLTFAPKATESLFYFLPSYVDQALALIRHEVGQRLKSGNADKFKLTLFHSSRVDDAQLANDIQTQLLHSDLAAKIELNLIASQTIQSLKDLSPDALLFLGNTQELTAVRSELVSEKVKPVLLAMLAMLGNDTQNFSTKGFAKVVLATPFKLDNPAMPAFTQLLQRHSVAFSSPGLQRIVCAAVDLVTEGLKRSEKNLHRTRFMHALEEIQQFPVDIMPPLQFSPGQHQGIQGAYIFEMLENNPTPVSDWVIP